MSSFDLTGQAELIREGEVSARELVEQSISKIEALEPKLSALTTTRFEQALEAAKNAPSDSLFAGAPFMHKDLVEVPGFPRSDGAHSALHQHPEQAPPLIAALQNAGLTFVAATNTPEFASLPVTANQTFGVTKNPWDEAKTAAGSSGGSAVAVAAGYVAAAHATDGAGSIRMPSSFCGTFGFKPSRGHLLSGESDGTHPLLKHHHAITRSVRDSAALYRAAQDLSVAPLLPSEMRLDKRLKIGLMFDNIQGAAVDGRIKQKIEATAKLCADMGHEIIQISLDGLDGAQFWRHVEAMFLIRMPMLVAAIEQATGAPFEENQILSPFTTSMGVAARKLSKTAEADALSFFDAHEAELLGGLRNLDIILSPVTPMMPFAHEELTPLGNFQADAQKIADMMSYMAMANVFGLPAMSIPAGLADGMPVGAHFMSTRGRDDVLFQLAFAIEEAAPWQDYEPPI